MESKSWKVVTVVKNLSYELFLNVFFFWGGGFSMASVSAKNKNKDALLG